MGTTRSLGGSAPGRGRLPYGPICARRTPVVDPDDHHVFVSLGAAAENLALLLLPHAACLERCGLIQQVAARCCSISPARRPRGLPCSTRLPTASRPAQNTMGAQSVRAIWPCWRKLLPCRASIWCCSLTGFRVDRLRDLIVTGNSAQMADPAFARELKAWLRFNPREALRRGDGLFSVASGNPPLPDWLGPLAFDWLATATSQNEAYARQVRSSAGMAVFVGAGANPASWVSVGQACQRFALQATALGLKCAFMNQPVEVPHLRSELAALVGLPGRRPDLVIAVRLWAESCHGHRAVRLPPVIEA